MRSYTKCRRLTVEGGVVGIFEELVSLKGGNCNVCNLRIGWIWVEGKKERTVFVGSWFHSRFSHFCTLIRLSLQLHQGYISMLHCGQDKTFSNLLSVYIL